MSLKGKTLFITGASRGIGLAIALRAARDGANIVIAAKTETPHPKLEGTIHSAAEAIEQAGGRALPLVVDVRDEAAVKGLHRPNWFNDRQKVGDVAIPCSRYAFWGKRPTASSGLAWTACSHSPSFDHRRLPDMLRTAIATAFFCPTNTTSRLPRVTPV